MSDRTVEIILKLTTASFSGPVTAAQQAVRQLGQAMNDAVQRGVNPLNIRLAATTAGTNAYRAAMQQGATATQASVAAAQAATQSVDRLGRSMQQAGKSSAGMTAALGEFWLAAQGAKTLVNGVTRAFDEFVEVGERAAERQRTARMFETLSGGAALATQNLQAMRRATNYTISEAEAMAGAVGLLGMRLARNSGELAQITQQVAVLGARFAGFSAERSIQQFMFAIENQSLQRLGEFGLAAGEVTRRVEELKAAGYGMEDAFRLAVLEGLDAQFQRIGGATVDAATAFEQYRAAVGDLTRDLENIFLPVALKVVQALTDIIRLSPKSLPGGLGPEAMAQAVELAMQKAARNPIIPLAKRDMEDVRAQILATARTQEELNAGMEVYYRLLDQYNNRYSQLSGLNQAALKSQGEALTQARQAADAQAFAQIQAEVAAAAAAEAQARAAQEAEAAYARQLQARQNLFLATTDLAQRQAQQEIAWARRAEDEAIAALRRQEDAARRAAQQRAQIAAQYARALAAADRQYQQAAEQAARQYARRREEIERQYQQRLRDIQRSYQESVFEATLNRDAAALFRAQRQRDEQVQQAQEQRDESNTQAAQQYAEQLEAARQAHAEQRQAALEAQAQALADLQASLRREAEEQALADRRRREDQALARKREQEDLLAALAAKMQAVYGTNRVERAEMSQHYTYLLGLASMYYGRLRQIMSWRPSLPAPAPTRPGARAVGGYADAGLYTLGERGREFVLNAETTRRLEGQIGGPLTQQNIVNRGLTVNATFAGMGGNDQAWFEARLQDFGRDMARMLEAA